MGCLRGVVHCFPKKKTKRPMSRKILGMILFFWLYFIFFAYLIMVIASRISQRFGA